MTAEETMLVKRFSDLNRQSENKGIYTYTGFLSQAEQELFYLSVKGVPGSRYSLFGGLPDSERKVGRFGSPEELYYDEEFPISCIEVKPLSAKFAEKLSHRDVLGALMNLGIERSLVGDIVVKESVCYVFCLERIADFIVSELTRIKHTEVSCRLSEEIPLDAAPELAELTLVAGSLRADGIISKVFHVSRSESESIFTRSYVFINGRAATKGSVLLKEGDVVSVRGFGKFRFAEVSHETRKGNLGVKIFKYV